MPKLPRISAKELIKLLADFGFIQVRQKGSHLIFKKVEGDSEIGCVVPLHKELAVGTLAGILRQAKISHEDFLSKYFE